MANSNMYVGFRYPSEIIRHLVWLYFRFSLSFRDINEFRLVTHKEKRQDIQAEIDEIIEANRGKQLSAIAEEKLEYLIRLKKQVAHIGG